jgi:hypothetical protein
MDRIQGCAVRIRHDGNDWRQHPRHDAVAMSHGFDFAADEEIAASAELSGRGRFLRRPVARWAAVRAALLQLGLQKTDDLTNDACSLLIRLPLAEMAAVVRDDANVDADGR